MIWSHINNFHAWWESIKDIQFAVGSDQFPEWWYDFHILIFIFYDDKKIVVVTDVWKGAYNTMGPWYSLE